MAQARDREAWRRVAWLAAVIAAPNRKDHRVKPNDYDPYELAKKPPQLPGELPQDVTNDEAEARYQEWRQICQAQER